MGTVNTTRPPLRSGYSEVFFDGFDVATNHDATGLDRGKWGTLYGGSEYWNKAFVWSHDDVRVDQNNSNEVTISATYHPEWTTGPKWSAGGFSSLSPWNGNPNSWQHGLFEFSAKVEKGQGTGPAVLLWPADNSWPPEIDLLEAPDANRQGMYFTVHWKDNEGNHVQKSYKFADVDASQWHTYGLEWEKNKLVFYVDGVKKQEHYEGDPNMKMGFGMQMFVASEYDGWYGGPPNQATMDNGKIDLSVDWVRVAQKKVESYNAMNGTAGPDTLSGTSGRDFITGLKGNDTMSGRNGADQFVFSQGDGFDRITDFQRGTDDLIFKGVDPGSVTQTVKTISGSKGIEIKYGPADSTVFLAGVTSKLSVSTDMAFVDADWVF
jgi:beta-glucanase (GH16 family)